jgi:hypothetical protein
MVETMCRETMGPSACKLTMRPVAQWSYSVTSRVTTRIDRLEGGCIIEVQSVELLLR